MLELLLDFRWLWALLLGTWLLTEGLYQRRKGGRHSQDRLSGEIMLGSLLLNVAVIVLLIRHQVGMIGLPFWTYRTAGCVLALSGIGLRYWAIRTLGEYCTSAVVVTDAHRLVDHGPFCRLRHPGYTGVMLFGAGMVLMLGSWVGVLVYLAGHGLAMHYRSRWRNGPCRRSWALPTTTIGAAAGA